MNAGALRHVIKIEERTITQGDYGEPIKNWQEFATVRADIQTLRGKEFLEGIAAQAEVTHKIRVRYITGIKPNMRIKHCGRTFTLLYQINVNERNREVHLYCKEVFVDE